MSEAGRGLSSTVVLLLLVIAFFSLTPRLALSGDRSPERTLPLKYAENARDLGGYTTEDGRSVRWGQLFRSASIAELDSEDIGYLQSLNLAVVTDFRSDSERRAAPDRLPQSPVPSYQTLAINDPAVDVEVLRHKVFSGALSSADLLQLTDRRAYVTDADMRAAWGHWLGSLAEPNALPQLFHCTAGKDRTGFAAALVLLALGVSREQVMEDFLLSNTLLKARIDRTIAHIQANAQGPVDTEALTQVIGVSPSSLEEAFLEMEARYGSVDNYISEGLGVDSRTRQRLREKLLE